MDDDRMGVLVAVCATAWIVFAVLGVFGSFGTHTAQTIGTVLSVVTFIGGGLIALARQL